MSINHSEKENSTISLLNLTKLTASIGLEYRIQLVDKSRGVAVSLPVRSPFRSFLVLYYNEKREFQSQFPIFAQVNN